MNYLSAIGAFTGDNLGGLLDLQVARAADIDSIPAPVAGVIYGDIAFKPGKGFYLWKATRGTPRFSGPGENTADGPLKKNAIDFILPKDQPVIRRMLELAEHDEFVVLFQDANGNQKLFGTLDLPAYFSFSQESGDASSSRNECQCRFFSEGPDNSFFYRGDIDVAPGGTAPAIVKRSDGTVLASLSPGQIFTITSPFSIGFNIE